MTEAEIQTAVERAEHDRKELCCRFCGRYFCERCNHDCPHCHSTLAKALAEAQDRYDALAVALPEMTDRIANIEAQLCASEAAREEADWARDSLQEIVNEQHVAQAEMRAALELFRLNSEHLRGCNIIHAWDGTEWARARRAECEGCPDGDGVAHWRCVPQCAAVKAALSSSGSGLLDMVREGDNKSDR